MCFLAEKRFVNRWSEEERAMDIDLSVVKIVC